ncbi:MAG: stage V sporulation protein AB [Lachnospiraceae bacterium]
MVWQTILLWVMGISSGIMVSAGVFTVLFVVGLVPRFAGRTDTARCELFYEECLIFGALLADILSVFPIEGSIGEFVEQVSFLRSALILLLVLIGFFAGIFVGCLSIALAEVLDGIPIFARRIRLKMGVSIAVLAVALGKIAGSLVYFINGFFEGI